MSVAAAVTSFVDADAEQAHHTVYAVCLEKQSAGSGRRLYRSLTPAVQCEHHVQEHSRTAAPD